MSEIRCPMCGKSNPSERETCQYCQARLKPLIISQQPDEPSAGKDPLAFLGQSTGYGASESEEEGVPDWLTSLRQGDQADLQSDEAEPSEEEEKLPDWMQADKVKTAGETQQDEGALPDWMSSFRDSGGQVEEGFAGEAEEYPPTPAISEGEEQALPDWLGGVGGATAAAVVPEESAEPGGISFIEEEPEWVSRLDETAGVPPDQSIDLEKPNWQDLVEEGEAQPETEPTRIEGPEQASSIDDQLSELAEEYTRMQPKSETGRLSEEAAAIPDWLSAVEGSEAEEEPESIPDWLAGALVSQAEPPGVTTGGEPEMPVSEDLYAALAQEPVAEVITSEEAGEEPLQAADFETTAPDWLDELVSNKPSAIIEPEEEQPGAEIEIPEWLTGYDEPMALDLEKQIPDVEGGEESGILLDWLEEEAEEAPKEPEAASIDEVVTSFVAPFALDEESQAFLESEASGWMAESADLEGAIEATAPPTEIEEDEGLSKAELPSWLAAMRPLETAAQASLVAEESERQVEGVGPLAGLKSVLPSEYDFGTLKAPAAYTVKLQVSESQKAHINLIDELIKAEGEAGEIPSRRILGPQHLLLIGIAVILLLALLWPVLTEKQTISLPAFSDEIFAASSQITNLPGNAPVLLAVDYEPGMTGELEATVNAVLDHLMLKGAYLTLVSTITSGPAQAERLVQEVSSRAGHTYQSPDQYTNLGFIPGSITGIRAFSETPNRMAPYALDGSSVWTEGPLAGFQSLADFGMVIVLTENPNTARAWIEQAGPLLGETPLLMVVSAQIEPVVRPYFEAESQQVSGIIAGLPGGAAYEQMIGRPGPARKYWDAYSLGVSLIALLIILGAVINVVYYLLSSLKSVVGETKR